MFNKKRSKHRRVPGINTTSTADISFMLLVFFLITTSIDNNKGILRQMPPSAANQETTLQVKRRNVMLVRLDDNNQLLCDEQIVTHGQLKERIMAFVENADDSEQLPEKTLKEVAMIGSRQVSDRHVIVVETDAMTSYQAYIQLLETVNAAYAQLRDKLAMECFGKSYVNCSAREREAVATCYPQRISESAINDEEGGQR